MAAPAPPARKGQRRQAGGPTIGDVAARAGVSAMTVSRVINDEANVRPATRAAVQAAIAALGYRPNSAARLLAGAAQSRIALLYSNPSAAYLSEFLVGSLAQSSRADALLLVEQCAIDADERDVAERLARRGLDGVVLPPPLCDSAAVRGVLRAAGIAAAVVATGAPPADAWAVTIDDRAAASEMTRHLIALGHYRIGFVTGDPHQTASAARLEGYRAALAAAELAADPALLAAGDFSYRSGLVAAEALLDLPTPPTAIFASNDDMAAAAIAVAHRRHLDVPRDLTVVGFDDTAIATTIWPELTTVRQPIADMAQAAVEMLVAAARRRRGGEATVAEHRLLPHALVCRGSDGPPPVTPAAGRWST